MSCVTCHVSHVTFHMSCVTHHNFYLLWCVTHDMWNMTCDTWHVTHDMLWGVNILSKYFWTKLWNLSVEGLLSRGPTPSSFFYHFNVFSLHFPKVSVNFFLEIHNHSGKSIEKKWSQIWKLLLIKGVRLPRNFFLMFFFLCANFALLRRIFLVLVLLSISVERSSRMRDFFK